MTLPNPLILSGKSIGLAALNATARPGSLQPWIDELEEYVDLNGKLSKPSVAYIPFSPPPVFWDYKCRKCRFWQEPNACSLVDGEISPKGWCSIWLPPDDYKALSWPNELLKGDW